MKHASYDFYAVGEAIAYGIRRSITLDDSESYEVYVKLANGNSVVAAKGGTRKQARKALQRILSNIQVDKALLSTLEDSYVDARRVVRVYIDSHVNSYIVVAEDTTGEGHRVFEGDKSDCKEAVVDLAATIAHLHNRDRGVQVSEDEDDDEEYETPFG